MIDGEIRALGISVAQLHLDVADIISSLQSLVDHVDHMDGLCRFDIGINDGSGLTYDQVDVSQTTEERDVAFAQRDAIGKERDVAITKRDATEAEINTLRAERDVAIASITEREAVIASRVIKREASTMARDAGIVERDATISERDGALEAGDASIVMRDDVIVARDVAIATRDVTITKRDATTTQRDVVSHTTTDYRARCLLVEHRCDVLGAIGDVKPPVAPLSDSKCTICGYSELNHGAGILESQLNPTAGYAIDLSELEETLLQFVTKESIRRTVERCGGISSSSEPLPLDLTDVDAVREAVMTSYRSREWETQMSTDAIAWRRRLYRLTQRRDEEWHVVLHRVGERLLKGGTLGKRWSSRTTRYTGSMRDFGDASHAHEIND
eukprot:Gb_08763 [translate_table: standard]